MFYQFSIFAKTLHVQIPIATVSRSPSIKLQKCKSQIPRQNMQPVHHSSKKALFNERNSTDSRIDTWFIIQCDAAQSVKKKLLMHGSCNRWNCIFKSRMQTDFFLFECDWICHSVFFLSLLVYINYSRCRGFFVVFSVGLEFWGWFCLA